MVINALRMRPDRVVLGEVRGEETLDMLQAMNTGHDGSLTTIHSNTPRDALARLETMAMMGEIRIAEKAVRAQIAAAVHIIIQASRMTSRNLRVRSPMSSVCRTYSSSRRRASVPTEK